MKFSICSTWGKKNEKTLEDVVEMGRSLGLEGIELWDGHIEDYIKRHHCDVGDLKEYLRENHLECCAIAPYFNLLTKDGFETSIQDAEQAIQYAKELDCSMIRTFVGWKPSKELSEEEWKQCIKGLKIMTNMVQNEKITFILETHNNQPIDTADCILYLMEKVNSEHLKVLFDGFNYVVDHLDIMEAYKKLEKDIVHYHMKNYLWTEEEKKALPLNEGDADFKEIIRHLKRIKYTGYISFEYFEPNPKELIQKSMDWIRTI